MCCFGGTSFFFLFDVYFIMLDAYGKDSKVGKGTV